MAPEIYINLDDTPETEVQSHIEWIKKQFLKEETLNIQLLKKMIHLIRFYPSLLCIQTSTVQEMDIAVNILKKYRASADRGLARNIIDILKNNVYMNCKEIADSTKPRLKMTTSLAKVDVKPILSYYKNMLQELERKREQIYFNSSDAISNVYDIKEMRNCEIQKKTRSKVSTDNISKSDKLFKSIEEFLENSNKEYATFGTYMTLKLNSMDGDKSKICKVIIDAIIKLGLSHRLTKKSSIKT